MNLLTVDHITKVYTQRELFHDASFYLQDGEKVGMKGKADGKVINQTVAELCK